MHSDSITAANICSLKAGGFCTHTVLRPPLLNLIMDRAGLVRIPHPLNVCGNALQHQKRVLTTNTGTEVLTLSEAYLGVKNRIVLRRYVLREKFLFVLLKKKYSGSEQVVVK